MDVTRAEKVGEIRRRCIRANDGVLWNDHGDILKRVIRHGSAVQGTAMPTKITISDVLATWDWVNDRRTAGNDDEDGARVLKEVAAQIEALWDRAADDLTQQSDKCIDLLAEHLLVEIPRTKRQR
jgi:hypothetical protein